MQNKISPTLLALLILVQTVAAQETSSKSNELMDNLNQETKLYIYRPFRLFGSLIGYDLYINTTKVGRVRPNRAFEVDVPVNQNVEIWAKTESKRSLNVNFEKGQAYYLHCDLSWGILVGRPKFKLVNPFHGDIEYKLVSKQISRKEQRRQYRELVKNESK